MNSEEALKIVYKEVEYAYDDKIKDKSNRNWNEDYEHYHNYRHAMTTIEKSLKALEIIKRKCVDIGFMKYLIEMNYNVNNYNIAFDEDDTDYMLTQEEFDLLKEVLMNDK